MSAGEGAPDREGAVLLLRPVPPAGDALPELWRFPDGLEGFAGQEVFRLWRRAPESALGVLHPEQRPQEGLLLGEICALGCAAPLGLGPAGQALLGGAGAEGLAFFLCLGAVPEMPEQAQLRICGVLAVALDSGLALRLSLPQRLPERLDMARAAAAVLR
ncbi:hypothetical protein [uncultured Desulfovibrio sp.]|uniref:hypothetical protein n=1 Tax=uncultured Desulfovibrio sp. TaxID=167968 RepID=UPI00262EC74F|nr:hypothetical protein [uncultured Desulfovibrio sp.]